jgi:hypothetical protein
MRTISILYAMLAVALLASCATAATTIVTRQRLDKESAGKLAYERIDATSSVRRFTQVDLDQLRDAVLARVQQPVGGGLPVTIQLAVTDYGAGGSKMIVSVRVVDAAGKSHAQFDVYRTANTVMGALDQRSSDISAVADAVARSLMAISAPPPATMDARNYGS